ncbi:MAG: translation initiation factor IF-2 [Anaerovoracaceae bacterium]|jgi:translation initiation factor IF-2
MRVYELAKELGITSREALEKLRKNGVENINSNMNSLSQSAEKVLRNAVAGAKKATENVQTGAKDRKDTSENTAHADKENRKSHAEKQNSSKNAVKSEKSREAQGRQNLSAGGKKNDHGDHRRKDGKNRGRKDRRENEQAGARDHRQSSDQKKSGRQQKPSSGQQNQQHGGRKAQAASGSRNNWNGGRNSHGSSDNRDRSRKDNRKNGNGRSGGHKFNTMKAEKPTHSHRRDHRKEQRKEAQRLAEERANAIPEGAVAITVPITVKGFAEQIDVSPSTIIMKLMKMGIMANMNENLDADTVQILGDELGKQIVIGGVEEEPVEEGIEDFEDKEEDLRPRPPVITVMGHVDHGKTSLLDKIRKTDVTASESGGITQHIGASEVTYNGQKIVFLDTPGHEAFTAMRARGAYITDIAVLVVAADDSVKPQTVEAISHAKAANVPIIVAINKIDKPGANVEKVKEDLSKNGILVEEWGGDVICVPVSAKTGEGIDNLLEMILLQAEMLELRANPNRLALGTVIEARLDKQKGPIATLLVQNGTLKKGMSIVAGNCYGRIKAMTNYKGAALKKAGPATAVEVLGLDDVPLAGDNFNAVKSDKIAREIAENRKEKQREQVLHEKAGVSLEELFNQIKQGEVKSLNLIIKADVQGSVGALVSSLEKLKNDEVAVKIIHTGVGAINESDVMLASTTDAIIIGFNVRPSSAVSAQAEREHVEIRTYSVIYEIIEDVEAALKGMLAPVLKEQVIGSAEIRNTFKVPNVGTVGGAYVTDGKMERNADIRLIRDGIVVHEGKISSLKRFKDDAREVAKGFECGIGIENFNDIKDGDVIEAYKMVEVEKE